MVNPTRVTDTVTVYSFRVFDLESKDMQVSGYKATRKAIGALRRAEVLEGTAEQVPASALDEHQHFRRRATGWGELA
jgi:hypothetical protein